MDEYDGKNPPPLAPSPTTPTPSSLLAHARTEKGEFADPPRSPAARDTNDVDITTKVFQFLSTATPGTLGGVAVGLGAVTYFILGQFGLLLIGAFTGVVLFVQWQQRDAAVSRAVRGERGFDVLERLLEAKGLSRDVLNERDPDEEEGALLRGFDDFQPETREALNELVDAIIRDYVKWWYSPILPADKSFPLASRKTLTSFLLTISSHLSRKRPADAFLDFLTNSTSIIIVFFSELSNAFAELPTDSRMSAADVVYTYLAENPDSNLSNLLSQRQQAGKFKMVSEDLLGFFDRSTLDCDPARIFLREILAGVCLEMTLQTCSKPEWINGWIVYLLEAGEPDFNQAIDVGMQTGPSADSNLVDIDGNVGNIGITKGNRNSFDLEKARRKESMAHKKKLSKADEEMEMAMEEMKRMNKMIADADALRTHESDEPPKLPDRPPMTASANEASERLADAFKRNANELDIQPETAEKHAVLEQELPSPEPSGKHSPNHSSSDGVSSKEEPLHTPITPRSSNMDSSSKNSSPKHETEARFTNFDQIVPPAQDEPDGEDELRKPPPLTLHNATITMLDEPGDKARIRTKPAWDYLVQIEPATTVYPGWMIVRKYADFERLHEILRRIAMVSGATAFTEQHKELPSWKLHTRSSLRGELERYLRDACWYSSLAESEGLKRFLEKEHGHGHGHSGSKSGFQAFEKLGKNVFDVLTSAPMEGSKAVVGGVTGVLGNMGLGQRKSTTQSLPTASSLQDVTAASRLSISTPPRMDSTGAVNGRKTRDSLDSQRSSVISTQPGKVAPMERRPSYNSQGEAESDGLRPSRSDQRASSSVRNSREHSRTSSLAPIRSPSATSLDGVKLPPPPDAMPDDYESPTSPMNRRDSFHAPSGNFGRSLTMPNVLHKEPATSPPKPARQYQPLSEQETRVAVELLFAVINELYTLSSAWNIRRTLLAAAKSFLLRPGNPSLTSIQSLIQTSVIEANASDSGIATHLKKLRENTMPTDEERAAWPEELTTEEKEKLRVKARKLLIESGVPAALMGVMGQSATSDALGRLFDCLQVEEVARGLMFGIMLQAFRTITH
ncbi:hypothetical protein GQ53DRAFT_755470 [Thozetella sp. PMI_491]|nr:hypothetical protein GQ53DRAFT_755470 [Thozetella sp. PMI_491]